MILQIVDMQCNYLNITELVHCRIFNASAEKGNNGSAVS